MFRQGDVLIIPEGEVPQTLKPGGRTKRVKLNHNRLAEGEVTGHAHRIAVGEDFDLFDLEADGRDTAEAASKWLSLRAPTALVHEEHAAPHLAVGEYLVVRQRQFEPVSRFGTFADAGAAGSRLAYD